MMYVRTVTNRRGQHCTVALELVRLMVRNAGRQALAGRLAVFRDWLA